WAWAAASGTARPRARSIRTVRLMGDTPLKKNAKVRSLLDPRKPDATSTVVIHPPGRPGTEPASTGAGTDRSRPSVAQALPKYVMGTGLVKGLAPGWAREVIGQDPSGRWCATRKPTPRRISARPGDTPAWPST